MGKFPTCLHLNSEVNDTVVRMRCDPICKVLLALPDVEEVLTEGWLILCVCVPLVN